MGPQRVRHDWMTFTSLHKHQAVLGTEGTAMNKTKSWPKWSLHWTKWLDMSCVLKERKYHVTKLGIGQKVRIRIEYFSNSSHWEKAFLDLTAMKHTVVFSRYFYLHTAKSLQSCLCQPTRLPCPWDSPGKNTGVGCHSFSNAWKWKVKVKLLSRVRLFATPWTAAYQAPLSMGFSRQEHWSGVPLPSLKLELTLSL